MKIWKCIFQEILPYNFQFSFQKEEVWIHSEESAMGNYSIETFNQIHQKITKGYTLLLLHVQNSH